MKKNTYNRSSNKFIITIVTIIVILSIFLVYSYYHEQVIDEQSLRLKTLKTLENTKSYRFDMYSNLSMLNEDLQIIKAEGQVDLLNNNMVQSMIYSNRSIEVVVINNQAYYRENNGAWQVQELRDSEILDDKLSEQRSVLFYAENATMSKVEGGWVLEIVPDREDILEQMGTMGVDTSGSELNGFVIRYWIEEGTFFIKIIETDVDVEINFMGMQTPVKLKNVIHLSNYNEKVEINAPI